MRQRAETVASEAKVSQTSGEKQKELESFLKVELETRYKNAPDISAILRDNWVLYCSKHPDPNPERIKNKDNGFIEFIRTSPECYLYRELLQSKSKGNLQFAKTIENMFNDDKFLNSLLSMSRPPR